MWIPHSVVNVETSYWPWQ